jgi:hypothetical protein
MHDSDKCNFLLESLKVELAAQTNTFDQIDNKTGVALGFTFIAVGQVLASVFRMASDQSHFRTLHPGVVGEIFVLANISVLLAIICGATARWPRNFHHSIEWTEAELTGSLDEIKNTTYVALLGVTKKNEETNLEKGKWAKATYAFVGLALIFYLALTVLLYMYGIPKG